MIDHRFVSCNKVNNIGVLSILSVIVEPCNEVDNVGCLAEVEIMVMLETFFHRWQVQYLDTRSISMNISISMSHEAWSISTDIPR